MQKELACRISEADRRAAINREIHASIDKAKKKLFDVSIPPSIDRRPEFGRRAFDLFGSRNFYWEEKNEYGVYRNDQEYARDLEGYTIRVHNRDIRKLMERASRNDQATYAFLSMLTYSHRPSWY